MCSCIPNSVGYVFQGQIGLLSQVTVAQQGPREPDLCLSNLYPNFKDTLAPFPLKSEIKYRPVIVGELLYEMGSPLL